MDFCKLAVSSILVLCISTLSGAEYSTQGTPLGNAGMNSKPVFISILEGFANKLKGIQRRTGTLDESKISNALENYSNENIQYLKHSYKTDIEYSLCEENKLIDCNDYKNHEGVYYKISEKELEYYEKAIQDYHSKSTENPKLQKILINAINNNVNHKAEIKEHFNKYVLTYLLDKYPPSPRTIENDNINTNLLNKYPPSLELSKMIKKLNPKPLRKFQMILNT